MMAPRQEARRVPMAVAVFSSAAAVTAFLVLLAANRGNQQALVRITDISNGAAALVAALTCLWVASKSSGHNRRGWALISASATVWFAGQVVWTLLRFAPSAALPFPSLADVGYLAAMPLTMAGVLAFWSVTGGPARWAALIDGLIVVVALATISWVFGLESIVTQAKHSATTALGLAYPFGDTLILTVLILSISRATRAQQGPMLLLLGGLGAMSVADATFAYTTLLPSSQQAAGVIDSGWVPGYLMVALAALWSSRSEQSVSEKDSTVGWQLGLPSLAVWAAAACILLRIARGGATDDVLMSFAVAMASLLAVSQLIAHRDAMTRLFKSRQSEALLSEMVAHARRGIAQTDHEYRIVAVNPGLEALLGGPADQLIGSPIAKFLPPDMHSHVVDRLGRLMRGEVDTLELEVPALRLDGRPIWIGTSSYAVRDAQGKVDYALTYLEDLTSKHEAEESERKSLHVLEDLNRVRMEFVRSISHEFKTGLVGIKGFSELIRDAEPLNVDEAKDYAADIYRSAEHLDSLVTEMTELDRVEMTPISLSVELVDLNEVVFAEAIKLHGSTNPITTDLAPVLPAVNADPSKLADVVRALLLNARKYSPSGGEIHVSTGVNLGEEIVNVRDEGEGMRADFDNQLFGSGDLYANNPIRKVVGTGLGLGIARRIVEMHGGHIWLERLEHGSVTHFTIPVAGAAKVPSDLRSSELPGQIVA